MKRKSIVFCAVLAAAAFGFFANTSKAGEFSIGSTLDNFTLPDTDGKDRSFNDLKGKSGAVVIFLSAQCPVVRGYNERISKLAAEYEAKGITFIGINSNSTEDLAWVKSNATENYKFPVLVDKGNVFADKLGATVTPEAYYFDAKNVLRYHGAIDNDRSGKSITESYLKTAFESTLAGKTIERTKANAFGCSIKRVGE
jgi:peroxiredoxin